MIDAFLGEHAAFTTKFPVEYLILLAPLASKKLLFVYVSFAKRAGFCSCFGDSIDEQVLYEKGKVHSEKPLLVEAVC